MDRALHIILSISSIILLFLTGLLLRKLRFLQPGTVQDIKKLVVSCSLPALLYGAFSSLELRRGMLLIVAAVFTTCILMVLIGRVIARLLRIKSPYFALLFGGFETGMIGYAIFISVYGAVQVDKLALIDLGQVLFVFSVLVALLLKLRGERDSIPALFKRFILQEALQLNGLYKKALFTMFLLPPPFVIPLFIDEGDRENIEFAVNTLSVGILISAPLFVIISFLI